MAEFSLYIRKHISINLDEHSQDGFEPQRKDRDNEWCNMNIGTMDLGKKDCNHVWVEVKRRNKLKELSDLLTKTTDKLLWRMKNDKLTEREKCTIVSFLCDNGGIHMKVTSNILSNGGKSNTGYDLCTSEDDSHGETQENIQDSRDIDNDVSMTNSSYMQSNDLSQTLSPTQNTRTIERGHAQLPNQNACTIQKGNVQSPNQNTCTTEKGQLTLSTQNACTTEKCECSPSNENNSSMQAGSALSTNQSTCNTGSSKELSTNQNTSSSEPDHNILAISTNQDISGTEPGHDVLANHGDVRIQSSEHGPIKQCVTELDLNRQGIHKVMKLESESHSDLEEQEIHKMLESESKLESESHSDHDEQGIHKKTEFESESDLNGQGMHNSPSPKLSTEQSQHCSQQHKHKDRNQNSDNTTEIIIKNEPEDLYVYTATEESTPQTSEVNFMESIAFPNISTEAMDPSENGSDNMDYFVNTSTKTRSSDEHAPGTEEYANISDQYANTSHEYANMYASDDVVLQEGETSHLSSDKIASAQQEEVDTNYEHTNFGLHHSEPIMSAAKLFICEICGKSFRQRSSLTQHHMIHTGEKPFPCSVCGKRFRHSNNLARHMRIHTGERPYQCNICGRRFNQTNILHIHKQRHFREKGRLMIQNVRSIATASEVRQSVRDVRITLPKKTSNLINSVGFSRRVNQRNGQSNSDKGQQYTWRPTNESLDSNFAHQSSANDIHVEEDQFRRPMWGVREPCKSAQSNVAHPSSANYIHVEDDQFRRPTWGMREPRKSAQSNVAHQSSANDTHVGEDRFRRPTWGMREPRKSAQSAWMVGDQQWANKVRTDSEQEQSFEFQQHLQERYRQHQVGGMQPSMNRSLQHTSRQKQPLTKPSTVRELRREQVVSDNIQGNMQRRGSEIQRQFRGMQDPLGRVHLSMSKLQQQRKQTVREMQQPSIGRIQHSERGRQHMSQVQAEIQQPSGQMQYRGSTKQQQQRKTLQPQEVPFPTTQQILNSPLQHRTPVVAESTSTYMPPTALFNCDKCNEIFTDEQQFNSHMSVHNLDRPFKCQHCFMTFKHKNTLNSHLRIHSGVEPYECPYCKKKFRHSNNLKRHIRIHTGERPYQCKICGKCFNQSNILKIHKKRHHTDGGIRLRVNMPRGAQVSSDTAQTWDEVARGTTQSRDQVDRATTQIGDRVTRGTAQSRDRVGHVTAQIGDQVARGTAKSRDLVAHGTAQSVDLEARATAQIGDRVTRGTAQIGDLVTHGTAQIGGRVARGTVQTRDHTAHNEMRTGNATILGEGQTWGREISSDVQTWDLTVHSEAQTGDREFNVEVPTGDRVSKGEVPTEGCISQGEFLTEDRISQGEVPTADRVADNNMQTGDSTLCVQTLSQLDSGESPSGENTASVEEISVTAPSGKQELYEGTMNEQELYEGMRNKQGLYEGTRNEQELYEGTRSEQGLYEGTRINETAGSKDAFHGEGITDGLQVKKDLDTEHDKQIGMYEDELQRNSQYQQGETAKVLDQQLGFDSRQHKIQETSQYIRDPECNDFYGDTNQGRSHTTREHLYTGQSQPRDVGESSVPGSSGLSTFNTEIGNRERGRQQQLSLVQEPYGRMQIRECDGQHRMQHGESDGQHRMQHGESDRQHRMQHRESDRQHRMQHRESKGQHRMQHRENDEQHRIALQQQESQEMQFPAMKEIVHPPLQHALTTTQVEAESASSTYTASTALFKCDTCDEIFTDEQQFNSHMSVHNVERPFKCEHCFKTFKHRYALNSHVRIHTGEEPFECPYCKKKFRYSNNLTRHIRIHTGERPYQCKICGKCFNQSNILNIHKKRHHTE